MSVFRVLIEQSLATMEGGKFQDFCLEFLPLYDTRFGGIARLGHTAAGKTRAGTPDLLKTDEAGQIAVQCGTDDDYWPTENAVEKSKPYKDGMKCIAALDQLVEIVLISNRETPTRAPNTKLTIANTLQRSTSARITSLAREDLSQFLIAQLEVRPVRSLVAKYCPEVAGVVQFREDAERLRVLNAVAEVRSVDARDALRVLADVMPTAQGIDAATEYALERLDQLSRCRLPALPEFAGVVRPSVAALPFLPRPHGKVWVVTGVPKIGKTNLILQAVRAVSGSTAQWFECPITDSPESAEEIIGELVRLVLPAATNSLFRSLSRLDAALASATRMPSPTVLVVDNADRMPPAGLAQLAEVLKLLRRRDLLGNLACVFIAARRLGPLQSVVDETIVAPAWTPEELGLLLDHLDVPRDRERPQGYLDLLAARSGGHPLLALVLARRHPRLADLVLSVLQPAFGLADEDLSREAQHLLYEELLTDADMQNFVQRLSVLLDRSPVDVLDGLRTDITPHIATPTGVLLSRLSPAVIEGSGQNGFQVAFLFRETAKRMVTPLEQQAVYRTVANRLLKPQGKTLIADRICSGITYAILGGEVDRGVFWTTMLLKGALDKRLPNESLAWLLERLMLMTVVRPPVDPLGRLGHGTMLLTFSSAYSHLGQHEKAADVLRQADVTDPGDDTPEQIREALRHLRMGIALGLATHLLAMRKTGARLVLESLGQTEFATVTPKQWSIVLELMAEAVQREGLSEQISATLKTALELLGDGNQRSRTAALRIGLAVGFSASKVETGASMIEGCFPEKCLGRLLRSVARGVCSIQCGKGQEGKQHLDAAAAIAEAQEWDKGTFWSDLQGHLGDAAREARENDAALKAYMTSRAAASPSSFMWAWSSWRLGVLREDAHALGEAAHAFEILTLSGMRARAIGARGAVLLRSGDDLSGLQCLAEVLEAYYVRHDAAAGPATAIAQAHLWRYSLPRAGRPIGDDDPTFPALGSLPYDSVLDTAAPRAGAAVAFFVLGEAFKAAGNEAQARKFLTLAADVAPETDIDRATQPFAVSALLGLLGRLEGDPAEIQRRVQQLLSIPRREGNELQFAQLIFGKDDAPSKLSDGGQRLEVLLTAIEQAVAGAGAFSGFWAAEVSCGRARLAQERGEERGRVVRLWVQALAKATASQNCRVMLWAGFALGFEFSEYTPSFRQLARCQFECLRGAEGVGVPLRFLGTNLFNQWAQLDFRRLSEKDVYTKRMLMDSAKEMRENRTPESVAEPVMVLLLARLHQHEGPSTAWARREVAGHLATIPEDVRSRVSDVPTQ